jgi:hypothetical protein
VRNRKRNRPGVCRERGAVAVIVAVCMMLFMAMAAMAIDYGYLCVVKSELQRSADCGALGGAKEYATSPSDPDNVNILAKLDVVRDRARHYVGRNPAGGRNLVLESQDIVLGYLSDPFNPSLAIDTGSDPADFNVVQVTTRRTADSPNGPVGLFFAKALGRRFSNLTATATAVLDDRFKGISAPDGARTPLIPFVLKSQDWQEQIVNRKGVDEYSVDPDDGTVRFFSDGNPEIQLYVQHDLGSGKGGTPDTADGSDNAGAGNFGILNIGVFSNSGAVVVDQIREGITGEQIQAQFGQDYVDVYTDGGSVASYDATGDPGLTATVAGALEERLGQIVGFFVYDTLLGGTGNNTVFHIVGIQFGRIVYVNMHGKDKQVMVQPEAYMGPDVRTDPDAPKTGGLITRLQLIR